MNILDTGYKIIGLVKKIRHWFNSVDLNNFSILIPLYIIYTKITMLIRGYFPVFFFSPLEFYSYCRHKMTLCYIENLFYSRFSFTRN